jgi:hypothetical protein
MKNESEDHEPNGRRPEARYAYYRRCQVVRKNGEQCKAPAEKDAHICYAHAGQKAAEERRKRERRALLEEAVRQMRRRGKPQFGMADIFMDFNAIQVTLAVMAQALIDGKIDCKTAGRLAVDLQTMAKLLWMIHHKGRQGRKGVFTAETRTRGESRVSRCAAGLDGSTRNMLLAHHDNLMRGGLRRRAAIISPQICADESRLSAWEEIRQMRVAAMWLAEAA